MARTYIPSLRSLVHVLCVYSARYGVVLSANLTPSQLTAFTAFALACTALSDELGEQPIVN